MLRRYSPADLVAWPLVERHLDEASFLMRQRRWLVRAPHLTFAAFESTFEHRLVGHIDGMAIAGPPIVDRLLCEALEDDDQHVAAAAALALLSIRGTHALDGLIAHLKQGHGAFAAGIAKALGLAATPQFSPLLVKHINKATGRVCAELLSVLSKVPRFEGVSPIVLLHENVLTNVDESILAARARLLWRAPRELRQKFLPAANSVLFISEIIAWLVHERGVGLELARQWLKKKPSWSLAMLLATTGNAADRQRLLDDLGNPERRAQALWALGFGGNVAAIEACVDLLDDRYWGRHASEMACALTGLEPTIVASAAEVDDAGSEAPLYEHGNALQRVAVASLRRVPRHEVEQWLSQHGCRLRGVERLFRGVAVDTLSPRQRLQQSSMRRRHAIALEVLISSGARSWVDCTALARRQRRQLKTLTTST